MSLYAVPAGKGGSWQGARKKPFHLQTLSAKKDQGGFRNILVLAETQEMIDQSIRTTPLPGGFVVIQVNKVKTQAKEVDNPSVWPDKLSLEDPGIPRRIEIFDDLRHHPQGVAALCLEEALRALTGQFGGYRSALMPEESKEPILSGIVVEGSFLKRGER